MKSGGEMSSRTPEKANQCMGGGGAGEAARTYTKFIKSINSQETKSFFWPSLGMLNKGTLLILNWDVTWGW